MQEQLNTKTFADNFDLPFTEAILYLKDRVSLTPEEFYKLDAKARFRAFTVAKLTGLDAIERVKQKLIKSTSSKEEFVKEVGKDEILKKVGFHKENPFYLETVYRTNISAAYNAGRWAQIKRNKDIIKYLRYIAIDDGRTTPICRSLNGTTLPVDDPFWKKYTPPNHFNCRSSIMPITKYQKGYRKKKPPKQIPETDKGFLANPFENWWSLTDSMARRIVEYGITEEIVKEAKKLCDRQFAEGECDEYKEVEDLLTEIENVEEKKKAIEEEFVKRLQTFDVKNPISSFKGLFVTEEVYGDHLNKRLGEGVIKDESDYIRKTFDTLAYSTSAYYENYSKSWDRILYDSKRKWMVVLTEGGYILSSMPVTKRLRKLFEDHFKQAKAGKQTLKIQRVHTDEKLKKEARRILEKI